MAASVAMQLLLVCPVTTSLTDRNRVLYLPVKYGPPLKRNANVCIRCLAEDDEKEHLEIRGFSDVLFGGTVAERINGKLANIGFVAAMAIEFARGQNLFTQISDGGIPRLLGTSVIKAIASWITLLKAMKVESSSVGFFT